MAIWLSYIHVLGLLYTWAVELMPETDVNHFELHFELHCDHCQTCQRFDQ